MRKRDLWILLLALAVVLEFTAKMIIPEMPFGGQVTLVSMLPVVLISYRYGMKWGFVASFTYALIEMLIGAKTVAAAFQPGYFGDGTMLLNACIMCLLDYILAYTLLGLGGAFRNDSKPGRGLMLGSLLALAARYAAHVLSGYILFSGWAEWFFTQDGFPAWGAHLVASLSPTMLGIVYSVVYNGLYMVPEIILGMAFLAVFTAVGLKFGMGTLILAHVTFCTPYIFIIVKGRLAGMDPSLEEASRDLGASPARTFLEITLPLIMPGVLSGVMLAFAMSLDDFVISFFVTGSNVTPLPLRIYSSVKAGVSLQVNALCTLMLLFVFVVAGVALLRPGRKNKEVPK